MNTPPAPSPLRILIADGSELVSSRLLRMVETIPGVLAYHPIGSATDLRTQVQAQPIDVLLIDMFLPGGAALDLLPTLTLPQACVVIVLGPADCSQLFRSRHRGATIHYFPKCRDLQKVYELLCQMASDRTTSRGA